MRRALFITMDRYPNGDAGAVRTHAFVKIFQSLNFETTVVGMGTSPQFEMKSDEYGRYTSFRFPKKDIFSRTKGYLCFHRNLKRMMFGKDNEWDAIVVVSAFRKTLNFLKRYAKQHSIPLLHDSVEWYSPEQFSIGRLHPSYIAKDRWNRKYIDESVRVISISSYLDNYFKNKNIKTTRIPVIMDIEDISHEKNIDKEKIVFLYAGSPGKKDYLHVIVEAFARLDSSKPFELKLIGITKEQLVLNCSVSNSCVEMLGDKLVCMGRIPRPQVLQELSRADFTVLMRSQEQRYAKAGFPTKFVESLATATPVISNLTSDLDKYLINGENGYIVGGGKADDLVNALSSALSLSYEERVGMQRKARSTAEKYFDYRKYSGNVEFLIEK